jgi:dihydrofolate synthase/folylpolyglutamate synthase
MTPDDLTYLYSLINEYRSMRYDLHNMRLLAEALGNPQDTFRSVLIAGTNGKGSVARVLSAMVPEAGLYTSPHLTRLNERIRIGDAEIGDDDLKEVFEQVKRAGEGTYFEMVTAMAFLYFRDRAVPFAVLEVGLGGRLDATNIVKQDVSVITSIGFDHQVHLGATLEEIAGEKAGIIKGVEPVIVGPGVDFACIRKRAGLKLFTTGNLDRSVRDLGRGYFEVDLTTPIRRYAGLRPKLAGRHQIDNLIVAIRAAECLGIPKADIERGANTATWPGRLERFDGRPSFLLDGAHNITAAETLAAFLREFYPQGVWMIFGAMADKQYGEMIGVLKPHARRIIFTRAQSPRAKDPAALQEFHPDSHIEPTVEQAIGYARAHAPAGETVLICGSLYVIGEARGVLRSADCIEGA